MNPRPIRLALIAVLAAGLAGAAWWFLGGSTGGIEGTLAGSSRGDTATPSRDQSELAGVQGSVPPNTRTKAAEAAEEVWGWDEPTEEPDPSRSISTGRPAPGEEDGWIMGQILSRGGAALPEILVSALPIQRQEGATKLWARTDGKGRYAFDVSQFRTQPYRIQVAGCSKDLALKRMIRLHRNELRAEDVRAGSHGVNFTIPIIGRMELLLTDATNSQPIRSYNLRWRHRGSDEFQRYLGPPADFGPDVNGISRLHLPLGELDLEVFAEGYEGRALQCSTTMGATGPRFHLALDPMVPIRIEVTGAKPFELFQIQSLALLTEQEARDLWPEEDPEEEADPNGEAPESTLESDPATPAGLIGSDRALGGFAYLEMGGRMLDNQRRGTGVWTGYAPRGEWHLRSPLNGWLRFEPGVIRVDGLPRTYRVSLAESLFDAPSASEVLQSSSPVPDVLIDAELEQIERLERRFDQ